MFTDTCLHSRYLCTKYTYSCFKEPTRADGFKCWGLENACLDSPTLVRVLFAQSFVFAMEIENIWIPDLTNMGEGETTVCLFPPYLFFFLS